MARREGSGAAPLPALYDTFLSHSHEDAEWVEGIAKRLVDDYGFHVWIDKWVLVPGASWQQAMAKGLNETKTCLVFIGPRTPGGWFQQEIERALDIQSRDANFRVIPVLMPGATLVPDFLRLRTWADFRKDEDHALHVIVQGIRGEPVGRGDPKGLIKGRAHAEQLRELQELAQYGIREEVIVEFQRRILGEWLETRKGGTR